MLFRSKQSSQKVAILSTLCVVHVRPTNFSHTQKIFDYSNQDAVGEQVHTLLAPQRYHEAYRRVFEKPATADEEPAVRRAFELTAMRRDGTEFPVEVSLSAVMLKGKWHAIRIIRDITERKLAEEALRESEALYRGLFDGVPIGLYRTTLAGQLLDANLALVDMLGYPDRESLLETTTIEVYADPVDRRLRQALMEKDEVVRDLEV
jgi:PAS domain S-box-containing protein